MKNTLSRRQFLAAASTAAVVAPLIIPRSVLAQNGRPGANDTVTVGLIGMGGRCMGIYPNEIKPVAGLKVVGISDFWPVRMRSFFERYPEDLRPDQGYPDFREMIEKEKPDGIFAMTATHQRAWVSAIAMQMGCHLFIEKAMCLTVEEGRYLVNCARKYNRVTQVGSQQRSLPLCKWACEQVHNGALGKVIDVVAPNFVGPNYWAVQPTKQAYPEGMTDEIWDMWTNQVTFRPYHNDLHRGWANWWDYEGGGRTFGVSGWGTHSYDQVNMAIGTSETGPVKIRLDEPVNPDAESGRFDAQMPADAEDTGVQFHHMARATRGPRAKMTMWFENGIELRLHLDGDRGPGLGCIVTGDQGRLEINRHRIASNPREIVASAPEEIQAVLRTGGSLRPETIYHVENWIDCIKTGAKCTADIEYGQRATTMCELVNIVRATAAVDEEIGWDPVNERFTNNGAGNAMLSRPRRRGFELPELA